jgi:superfamily II DNA or RNA helicase
MPPTLRPYQIEAITAIDDAIAADDRHPLIVLPTGAGKTVVFGEWLRRRGGRALILAHRDELIDQAYRKVLDVFGADLDPMNHGDLVGKVKAERDDADAQIVVGSVQTLSRERRLQRVLAAGPISTVVCDEAHHAPAATYRKIFTALRAGEPDGPVLLGVTATPERADKVSLAEVFGGIVYQRTMLDLIDDNYLVDLRGKRVVVENLDLGGLKTRAGDFALDELNQRLTDANAPHEIVAAYQRYGEGRVTLVFVPGVAIAHDTAAHFRAAGVAAEAVDGTTKNRREIFERLASGETRVIVNCEVLTEGFDQPNIACVMMARPTKSKSLYIQMIGRGTRLHPGKPDCLVLDLVGVSNHHDLYTVDRLAGLTVAEMAKGTKRGRIERAEREAREAEDRELAEQQRLAARELDLRTRASGVNHHRAIMRPRDGGGYTVYLIDADGRVIDTLGRGVDLATANRLVAAHSGDHDAAPAPQPVYRMSDYARARPASDKQRAFLDRHKVHYHGALTAGEASDLIERRLADLRSRKVAKLGAAS